MLRGVLPQTQRQERHVLMALNHEDLEDDEEEDPVDEVVRFAPQRRRQGQGIQWDQIRRVEVD